MGYTQIVDIGLIQRGDTTPLSLCIISFPVYIPTFYIYSHFPYMSQLLIYIPILHMSSYSCICPFSLCVSSFPMYDSIPHIYPHFSYISFLYKFYIIFLYIFSLRIYPYFIYILFYCKSYIPFPCISQLCIYPYSPFLSPLLIYVPIPYVYLHFPCISPLSMNILTSHIYFHSPYVPYPCKFYIFLFIYIPT